MNFRILFLLLVLPMSAHADIYKWKDSNGVIRYSDIPPPASTPYESIGSKKVTVKPQPESADKAEQKKPAGDNVEQKKSSTSEDAKAAKRQETAEETKKKEQDKEAELKQRQQNCTTAKGNLQTYKQGGRIYKTKENGEREFMSDADIASNLDQAQKEVEQYCDN